MSVDYQRNTELLQRIKEGDTAAGAELLENNMGLVRSIALRFRDRAAQTHCCELEDLIQLGSIGMIKAMNSYDEAFGTAFSTYAVPLIIGEIKRFLRDDGPVKVSRNTKRNGMAIFGERERIIKATGKEPSVDELSEALGISKEDICTAILAMKHPQSFSEPVNDDGTELGELLSHDIDEIELTCDRLALREAVATLPELWQKIIVLRYYKELSQQKTADILGLTQVKISREEKKIFEKLRSMF